MHIPLKFPLLSLTVLLGFFSCHQEPVAPDCNEALDNWTIQSFDYPDIQKQHAVFFPSERVGFTAGNYGTIVKTTDGGQSWTVIHSGAFNSFATQQNLNALFFIDEMTGFAAGERKSCCFGPELGKGAVLLKTTNSGQSWQKRYLENVSAIDDLRFFDAYNGIALFSGDTGNNQTVRRLMRTEDGGDSWSEVPLPVQRIDGSRFFASPSTTTILVSGEHGEPLLATSSDKGQSWQFKNGPWDKCNRLHFIDDNTGFAICGLAFLPESVFETRDGGNTWTLADSPMQSGSLIHFNTPDSGFVINPVYTYESAGGELNAVLQAFEAFQTSDGGQNWEITRLDKTCDFTGLAFAPRPNTLFSIGSTANRFEWK